VKHELALHYQTVPAMSTHEEDPLDPVLTHSASPQSLQPIQGTHPQVLLQSLPPQEALLVTPANIGPYHPGYPFGMRWTDQVYKVEEDTGGYVLPNFRIGHMH
jgi:hypothetical protein